MKNTAKCQVYDIFTNNMTITQIKQALQNLSNPSKAKILQWFFKTGKWQYGEWDIFLGITVPEQRKVVKKYFKEITFPELQELLNSEIHEYRFVALETLVFKYKKWDEKFKKDIFDFYISNTAHINNWDLVDLSAPHIVGNYLLDKNRNILYKLAISSDLWEKRIAILSTFEFIKKWEYVDCFAISEILLQDTHDLIQKAVWWMLREVGKRIWEDIEELFLLKHYKQMPRTMLRYAIERFEESKRKKYLNWEI